MNASLWLGHHRMNNSFLWHLDPSYILQDPSALFERPPRPIGGSSLGRLETLLIGEFFDILLGIVDHALEDVIYAFLVDADH